VVKWFAFLQQNDLLKDSVEESNADEEE